MGSIEAVSRYAVGAPFVADMNVSVAAWPARTMPDATIAAQDLGALAFYTDATLVDVTGLGTSPTTSPAPPPPTRSPPSRPPTSASPPATSGPWSWSTPSSKAPPSNGSRGGSPSTPTGAPRSSRRCRGG